MLSEEFCLLIRSSGGQAQADTEPVALKYCEAGGRSLLQEEGEAPLLVYILHLLGASFLASFVGCQSYFNINKQVETDLFSEAC